MSQLGFYNFARNDPTPHALVDPSGRAWTRGELLAAVNRLTHGLRAAGLGRGDCLATVVQNGAEMIQLYLAAFQSGLYITPINHHLTAPEVAYILQDSEARIFVGSERFPDACAGGAAEAGLPESQRFAIGALPGFRPLAEKWP